MIVLTPSRSHRHQVAERVELGRPDPADLFQIVDRWRTGRWARGGRRSPPPSPDRCRAARRARSAVAVFRSTGPAGAVAASRVADPPSPAPPAWLANARTYDPVAVDHRRREVERVGSRVGRAHRRRRSRRRPGRRRGSSYTPGATTAPATWTTTGPAARSSAGPWRAGPGGAATTVAGDRACRRGWRAAGGPRSAATATAAATRRARRSPRRRRRPPRCGRRRSSAARSGRGRRGRRTGIPASRRGDRRRAPDVAGRSTARMRSDGGRGSSDDVLRHSAATRGAAPVEETSVTVRVATQPSDHHGRAAASNGRPSEPFGSTQPGHGVRTGRG